MGDLVRIKFRADRVVQDERVGTEAEESYRAGQVVDLPPASAEHWTSRGVAFEAPNAALTDGGEDDGGEGGEGSLFDGSRDDDLEHLGGGWYVLPDGNKVQGRAAARAALAELEG